MADVATFDEFYLATCADLLRQLTAMTGDPDMAQDVLQKAYARAWQHWPESLVSWSSEDGSTWLPDERPPDGDPILACNELRETHWSASTDVGTVRVEPFGHVGVLYCRPAD